MRNVPVSRQLTTLFHDCEFAAGLGCAAMSQPKSPRKPIVLGPGEGRTYPMGRIDAVFKADGAETGAGYSISEWWLEPHTAGPGPHSHPEDDVFYVIAGTMSVLVDDRWTEAAAGSFVLIPGGVTHDFENRGDVRAGVLNFYAPGTFEEHMPEIARWWRENPPKDAGH
jgi:mannose-6-phosphate isomerase-like protein (cupin superfamily)